MYNYKGNEVTFFQWLQIITQVDWLVLIISKTGILHTFFFIYLDCNFTFLTQNFL